MGCCSSSTLSQVSSDAHAGGDRKDPQKKAQPVGGKPAIAPVKVVAESSQVDVPSRPASPASPPAAAPVVKAALVEPKEDPLCPPGVVPGEASPGKDLLVAAPAAAVPEAPAVLACGAPDVGKGGPQDTPSRPSISEKAALAASAALQKPFRLVPVGASEEEIAVVFDEYFRRLPAKLSKTLDCSWQMLQGEIAKERAGSTIDGLEWHWLTTEDSADAATASGLVVFRVARGASANHGQVCHLSIIGDAWREKLPAALDAVRSAMFHALPIASMRVCLWYADQEDGAYRLDREVEGVFKEAGFRWFQLMNTAGRRGQIMALRRLEDRDPVAPAETVDLALATCLVIPQTAAAAAGAASAKMTEGGVSAEGAAASAEAVDAAPAPAASLGSAPATSPASEHQEAPQTPHSPQSPQSLQSPQQPSTALRAAGNPLVLAECLRRHVLQQREQATRDSDPASAPDTDAAAGDDSGEALRVAAAAGDLFERLARRGRGCLTCVDAAAPEACEAFLSDFLRAAPGACSVGDVGLLPLPEEGFQPTALCGGFLLQVNWKDHQVLPDEPHWARVAVHATGQLAGPIPQPVAYLATEDDDILAMVWPLPEGVQTISPDELYANCRRILREAPPTDLAASGTLEQVLIPRFLIRARAAAELPKPLAKAGDLQDPREVLIAQVAGRALPRGALRRERGSAAGAVLRLDAPFLFCLWHAHLDDVEIPLFAMVVGPNDWGPAA